MSNTTTPSDHLTALFYEVYHDLPRGGPGDPESAARALGLMPDLPAGPRVLELGCGPGAGVATLAAMTQGCVCALDLHHAFVAAQVRRATGTEGGSRVSGVCADMSLPPFRRASFDLVWSEGALYSIGFTNALRVCAELVRPGGYLAASEAVWTVSAPPDEIRRWWQDEYPDIAAIASKVADVAAAGFKIIGHFTLPPTAWSLHYYGPMRTRLPHLRRVWMHDEEGLRLIAQLEHEIDMHDRFGHTYSYEFIVGRRTGQPDERRD